MPSFNYETTTGFASVSIKPGHNAFRLPEEPMQPLTASSLLQAINEQLEEGQVTQIDLWNPDFTRWDSYHVGFPFGDFPIVAGEEYWLTYEGPKVSEAARSWLPWVLVGAAILGLVIVDRKGR